MSEAKNTHSFEGKNATEQICSFRLDFFISLSLVFYSEILSVKFMSIILQHFMIRSAFFHSLSLPLSISPNEVKQLSVRFSSL